jgi:hypothetical protein
MFACADCSFCKRGPLQFTVSNIHMDEDKRDEETKNKNSQLDVEKFKKDVASMLALAEQVGDVLCPARQPALLSPVVGCKPCFLTTASKTFS